MRRRGRLAVFAVSVAATALAAASCLLDWPPPRETSADGGAGGHGGSLPDGSVAGHLYVVGGFDPTDTQVVEVLAAPIFADGSWGEWEVAGSLPAGRDYHAGATTPKHLYVLGGETTTFTSDALVAPLDISGQIAGFSSTTAFTNERFRHTSVIAGQRIYVIGGYTFGALPLADVQLALVNRDGSLGGWAATTPLPSARHRHASSTYNGFVYVLGGSSEGTVAYLNDVLVARVSGDGTLGRWSSVAPFVNTRHGHASVAANGRVYVLGGISGSGSLLDDVQVATMNTDGTLGSWIQTTSLSGARQSFGCTLFNNRIYVVGGSGPVGGRETTLPDGQFATIQPDGTLGAWTKGPDLPVGRRFHTIHGG